MSKISNKELKEIFNDIQKHFNEFYEKYYNFIYNVSFSILKNKDDTEDVTQNVFMKLEKMQKEKLPSSNELSWLYKVTKNETIEFLRKEKQTVSLDEIYIAKEDDNIEEIIDKDTYNKMISNLNEDEKEIVSLKILADLSFKEISKVLNKPIGTVQWKYYKAINTLKLFYGNLLMFITTLFLYFRIKPKDRANKSEEEIADVENKILEDKQESQKEENKLGNKLEEGRVEDEIIQNEVIENTQEIRDEQDYYIYKPVILGISTIFLFFTIIFGIILIKYQQNRKKKTSK